MVPILDRRSDNLLLWLARVELDAESHFIEMGIFGLMRWVYSA